MSLESLKKQAGRLVAYLGEHHKLRLKHSSALEAIAAVYGARNWATLQAKGIPLEVGSESADGRGLPTQSNASGVPLVWQDGVPALFVSQADWSRHTLAEGVPYYTLPWLEEHLLNCKRTFAGGVFINVVEGESFPLILDLHRDVEGTAVAPEYNLLAGLNSDEVCEVLMHAYPAQPPESVRDYVRTRCGLALKRILPAELPPNESLSLGAILLALTPDALRFRMGEDSELAEELRSLAHLNSGGSANEEHVMWSLDNAFGPLIRGLRWLKDIEYGRVLFSNKSAAHGARTVVDCFARGDLLHVTLPDDDKYSVLRNMWMEVMYQAVRRKAATAGAREKQVVLGVGRCKYFAGPVLESFARQGRGQGLVLLLSTGSELELSRTQRGGRILQNIQNRLKLGPPTEEEVDQMLREFEQSTARLRSPSGNYFR